MNILVTGSSGFLGSALVNYLSSDNYVKTLSRNNSDYNFDLSFEIPVINEKFDCVIHAAGKAHFPRGTKKVCDTFDGVNFLGTKNLLQSFEKCFLPSRFIFISSVSVYGLESGSLIDENMPLIAVDEYGTSKIKAEKFILDWCKSNNVLCTILRLPLLVGSNPPGNLGNMVNGINKGYYFNIAGGRARKSMVLVTDVAKYILKASEVGGIYNLTDGYHPSFNELSNHLSNLLSKKAPISIPFFLAKNLALFGDFFGSTIPINTYKLKKIISDLTFDDSKARNSFGWCPSSVICNNFILEN